MRRRLLLLAAAVPFAAAASAAIAHGCSDEPTFDSACAWLGNPDNCFREFHTDMLAAAGPDNSWGDCRTYDPTTPASQIPTQVTAGNAGVNNGVFQKRASLGTCILNAGGQVTVDPPIDLTNFPPSPYADPITYTLTFVNPDGNTCGSATYSSPHGFSITINPPPDAGTTVMADSGVDSGNVATDGGEPDGGIPYGTYTQVNPPGRDSFDVTCPAGDAYHFSLDEVNITDPDAGSCPELASLVPSASFQVYPGGTDVAGGVSFAINYPPGPSVTYTDGGTLSPTTVVYFNCQIPAADETCMDGVKDGDETDVDCGGPQNPSDLYCGSCPARCEVGQNCLCDDDCDPHAGLLCFANAMSGARQCQSADAGTHSFPLCSYSKQSPVCPAGSMNGLDAGAGGGGAGGSGTSSASSSGAGGAGGAPADAGHD